MPHSLKFGGTAADPFGSAMKYLADPVNYGVTVLLETPELLARLGIDVQAVPYGFGGVSWGAHYEPKLISVPCVLKGDSVADVVSRLDNLNYLLNKSALAALCFDDIPSRYWMVRFSGSDSPRIAQRGAQFTLEFTAPDPRAYSITETTQTVSLSTGTNSFNVPASGTLGGNVECDPVYVIKPTGSGGAAMTLGNAARSESLTYANSLTSSEWLRVDTTLRQIAEKTTDSGATYAASMTGVTGAFPRLSPRIANAMTLTGITSTGSLVITYRERYL